MTLSGILAVLLLPTSSGATELSLRLERGGEVRTYHSQVLPGVFPGEHSGMVLDSTGSSRESLSISVQVSTKGSDRFMLFYGLGWEVRGSTVKLSGLTELWFGEEALISESPGEWSLRGKITRDGKDTCREPGGGGLFGRVRLRSDGAERTVRLRMALHRGGAETYAGRTGDDGVSYDLRLGVERLESSTATVRYVTGAGESRYHGTQEAIVPLGVETLVEGDGETDGVWLTVTEEPLRPPGKDAPELPDPKSGWLRHAGPVVTFLHPPHWRVTPTCGDDRVPVAWGFTDMVEPEWGGPMSAGVDDWSAGTVAERAAELRDEEAEADLTPVETVKLDGGRCLLWRVKSFRSAAAVCEIGSLQLELRKYSPRSEPDDFPDFKRLVESLAPGAR